MSSTKIKVFDPVQGVDPVPFHKHIWKLVSFGTIKNLVTGRIHKVDRVFRCAVCQAIGKPRDRYA